MWHLNLIIVFTLVLLAGCASGSCRAPVGNPSITPSRVAAAGGHVGEFVRWGGAMVEARHLKDSTELEVISYPLDRCGRPNAASEQTGRFIIVHPGFLETTDFQTDSQVSATGRITGIREGRIGHAAYRFPLLESYKVHLWPHQQARDVYSRPWLNIGIGGGSGGVYGGVGVAF